MAPRKKKQGVDKNLVIEAFAEMAKDKKIDKDLLHGIIEETLSLMVKRKYGNHADFEIVVNMDKGDLELYLIKEIVEEVTDPTKQITLEEAQMYSDEELEIGEEFIEEITLENIAENFGRRLISFASQTMNSKIREIERNNLFLECKDRVGEIVTGEIYQVRRNEIILYNNKFEMKLPRLEQIPNEMFRVKKNKTIRAIIKEVRQTSAVAPEIILSRRSEEFLVKLLEIEVPEISDGIIQVKAVAREPGVRAKVSVASLDERIDAVGACVGIKGVRINSIMRELNNEHIDLVYYSDDPVKYISNALTPATIKEIILSPETKSATVIVPEEHVSTAIGRNGQNVRLASQLTGYDIKLLKEGGEDIEIQEFEEEIGSFFLENLLEAGIQTARDFLETEPEVLLKIEGSQAELIMEIRKAMLIEFNEREDKEYVNLLMQAAERIDDEEENYDEDENTEYIDDKAENDIETINEEESDELQNEETLEDEENLQ
ncbi:MAG: transcription termination factor NusA [Candidatus Kapaibacterium sp.]|jgi:N utilization substance protein A